MNVNVKNGVKASLDVPLELVCQYEEMIHHYPTHSCHVPSNGCEGSGLAKQSAQLLPIFHPDE